MELVKITIRGTEYPACFSLRAAMRVSEKFGSIDVLFQEKTLDKAAEINTYVLHECLLAGKAYAALEGEQTQDPPQLDVLYDCLGVADSGRAVARIMEASNKVTVELQADEKKAKATQG